MKVKPNRSHSRSSHYLNIIVVFNLQLNNPITEFFPTVRNIPAAQRKEAIGVEVELFGP